MKSAKTYQLFCVLTKKERRVLVDWAQSPVFNRREAVEKIIIYWNECLDDLHVIPTKAQLWSVVFGKETYHDHRLRIELSHLQHLIENFLAISTFQNNRASYHLALSATYRSRNLEKHFWQNLKKIDQEHEQEHLRNDQLHSQRLERYREQYQWEVSRKRLITLPLKEMIHELDHSFVLQKLRQACRVQAHQQVEGLHHDLELLPAVLQWVERRIDQGISIAVKLYYHAYRMLAIGDLSDFQAFKTPLLSQDDLFDPSEQRDLYLYGINYCVRAYNRGERGLLADHFDLYQVGLEKAYLLHDGQITSFTYQNVVTLGLILKRYEWIGFFNEQFSRYLPAKQRKDLQSYTTARLAYARGQFQLALENLHQTQYVDLLMQLSARILLIKIYYATGAYQALESQVHACEVFIRRKPELAYHRANYQHMLAFVRRILALPPQDRAAKKVLRQAIQAEKALAEKSWLLEQVK